MKLQDSRPLQAIFLLKNDTSFKLHESRSNRLQCIQNEYMYLYKSLGKLLKENNKLKKATVLFLRKKHNSVRSFRRGASKVILNDSPFNFCRCRIKQVIELFHSYQILCDLCGDKVRALLLVKLNMLMSEMATWSQSKRPLKRDRHVTIFISHLLFVL